MPWVMHHRPEVQDEVEDHRPTAAYYCGGARLGDTLQEACHLNSVPFYREEFLNTTWANAWPCCNGKGGKQE